MIHSLKVWPAQYKALLSGEKQFEIRINDRVPGFSVGDTLELREWNPETKEFTGDSMLRNVTYIIQGEFGLPPNVCVMQLDVFDAYVTKAIENDRLKERIAQLEMYLEERAERGKQVLS